MIQTARNEINAEYDFSTVLMYDSNAFINPSNTRI